MTSLVPVILSPHYHPHACAHAQVHPDNIPTIARHFDHHGPLKLTGTHPGDIGVFCAVCTRVVPLGAGIALCQHCCRPTCISDTATRAGVHIGRDTPIFHLPVTIAGHFSVLAVPVASCLGCVARLTWAKGHAFSHERLAPKMVSYYRNAWSAAPMPADECHNVAFADLLNGYINTQRVNDELQDRILELESQLSALRATASEEARPPSPSIDTFIDMYNRAFKAYDQTRPSNLVDHVNGLGLFPGPASAAVSTKRVRAQ